MIYRTLGRSGIQISALGMGCWAIGGVHWRAGQPIGWGKVDDAESIRAIRRAAEMGVNFFDTADVYGCGHSEQIVAEALAPLRGEIIVATKFGLTYDQEKRESLGTKCDPAYIRSACEASLRRLKRDAIDLYQFHLDDHDPAAAAEVRDVLEELVAEGKVRYYGWSTDDPDGARVFAEGEHCTAIQQAMNVFGGNSETLSVCEQGNLASIIRSPLAMGLLTGKFDAETKLPEDDVRCGWDFKQGRQAERLRKLDAIRDMLRSGGRTLAQGALAWLWARSETTIPIPGFKTVAQVEENVRAMDFGPLPADPMAQIDEILS